MAERARDELRGLGAKTELRTYDGGHGWHGDVYGEIRRGIAWLEANHAVGTDR
jgi:predicted esterase